MNILRCLYTPKKGLKRKMTDSREKSTSFKESLLQNFFVWKLSAAELYGIHRAQMVGGGRPLKRKFCA